MIFKNFCPYAVSDIYITTNSANPSTVWLGTTWEKIEGRFLLGTSSSQVAKLTGGSMSKTIAQANLPNIKLKVDTFTLNAGNYAIKGIFSNYGYNVRSFGTNYTGAFYKDTSLNKKYTKDGSDSPTGNYNIGFDSSRSGASSGSFGSASPQTSALGSGQALDITPAYYTTHIWLRTS